ncbi:S8 family serine peptidase [Massilia sp. RP-1-19]|uniref:S8 family serine peptidase n=2 Tax=Massilia polaris TaxID=2728846 RepID=A0A848HN98_9BURK|nr:S8 family serine peptidase [Massilia polaris]
MIPAGAHAEQPEKFAAGRILVSPRAGLPAAEFNKIIKTHGAHAARKLGGINVYVVDMPPGREKALLQALERNPHVKFVELDGEVTMQMTPSDTYYSTAWHLPKIGAPAAWDVATGSGVTIAILDGGVEASHPDLAGHMVPGWNFFDNNSNTADVNGHGTKVAGVAAAIGNNAVGATGAAWNAKIMPMRISDGAGNITYYSTVANALTWAADHGARVANISYIVSHVAAVQTAAQYMRSKGGVVVASAGNTGAYTANANTSAIITVAGTDSSDVRASWSAYGPIVDVAAPGVSIRTTAVGGAYGSYSGTSFSSPLTAGVVALMLSANPALQPSQVDSILASTADDKGTAGRDDYYGYGRINATRAIAAAKAAVTSDTSVPVVSATVPSATVKGITTVSATATDNVGVTRVELYAGSTLVASDTASPYSFSWDSTTRADGATSLVVKAYDAAGNVGSKTLSVTVANNTIADTTAPVVTIGNPKAGTTVAGNVGVTVSASDNVAVTSTSLYIDGSLKATGNSSLSYTWNSRKGPKGLHTISAVARDGAGNTKTQAVQVTVN